MNCKLMIHVVIDLKIKNKKKTTLPSNLLKSLSDVPAFRII